MTIEELQKMSAAQIRAFKRTLDPESTPVEVFEELDELILDKRVEERVASSMAATRAISDGERFDEMAFKRWPELKNEASDFRKKVNELIDGDESPKALYNAANDVGYEMFGRGAQRTPPASGVAPGRSDTDPGDSTPDGGKFVKSTDKLRTFFEGEGLLKATPEALARIEAASAAKED